MTKVPDLGANRPWVARLRPLVSLLLMTVLELSAGAPATFADFESGHDPGDPFDRAIMAARKAVFPHHQLMPDRPPPFPARGLRFRVLTDRCDGWQQMAEIDGSRAFDVTADALWAVVADPARLPDWVPTMRLAQPSGMEEVHVEGESHGHPYSLDSLLRTDESDRRLDWGAEGDDGYRGSLRIAERPSGSEVHLHVAVPDDRLGASPDQATAEIRRGMEETFDRLASLIT